MGAILSAYTGTVGASGDTTGATDQANLNRVLSAAKAGTVISLIGSTFYTTGPLVVPPGVTLQGSQGNTLSLTDYGTTIQPVAAWAQGSAAAAAVILLVNQTDGGYSGTSEEQRIINLMIDGTNLVATADGIQGFGNVQNVLIRDVSINFVTGNSLSQVGAHGSSPDTWRCERVIAHRAQLSGYVLAAPDSTYLDCEAIGSAQAGTSVPGWSIGTCSNSKFIGCRSENTGNVGNGYTYTGSNSGGGGVEFISCSTTGNGGYGIQITTTANAGSGPVTLSGCRFNGDGANPFAYGANPSGTGGGGYAGIYLTNANMPVHITGCMVVPSSDSTTCPQYALKAASNKGNGRDQVMVTNSLLWGYNTSFNLDNSTSNVSLDASCILGTGPGSGPTFTLAKSRLVAAKSTNPAPTVTEDLYFMTAGTLGTSMRRDQITSNTISTSSGQAYFRSIWLPAGVTITNCVMRVGTTAKTGGTHAWFALCDNNFKVLAASTDQTDAATTFGTTNADQSLAVTTDGSTKYVTTYSGVYYVIVMVANSAGTQPNFCGASTVATNIAGATPLLFGTCSGGSTTPPAVGTTLGTLAGVAADNFYAYVT